MLKIGDFSKLSHLTVKALRFYEKEGLLIPSATDGMSGYRYYETEQLETAAKIKAWRQLDLSIAEIRDILSGADALTIFSRKKEALEEQKAELEVRLSAIKHILEGKIMDYQAVIKHIPGAIVYTCEARVKSYSDMMTVIPGMGEEVLSLNPGLECANPPYEFCEYPEGEYKDTDILIRHSEAVTRRGIEGGRVTFREIPAAKVISVMHKGPYDTLGEAYAFIMKYAKDNGYTPAGLSRECYIDGIWNKETPEEWLTEIQLPVED